MLQDGKRKLQKTKGMKKHSREKISEEGKGVREGSSSKKNESSTVRDQLGKEVEEAAAWKRIDDIDRRIQELEAEKCRSTGILMHKTFRSPRESSKRGTSMTTTKIVVESRRDSKVNMHSRGKTSKELGIHYSQQSVGQGSVTCSDALSLGTWDTVKDIPPLELNGLFEPVGMYWEHLSQFAFERAKMVFEWHLEWRQQEPEMKSHFKYRLKQIYPGNWCGKYVMHQVGNNLKEKRNRLRKRFEKVLCLYRSVVQSQVGMLSMIL